MLRLKAAVCRAGQIALLFIDPAQDSVAGCGRAANTGAWGIAPNHKALFHRG